MDKPESVQTTPTEDIKETKEIITPYAFGVADSLIGIPLATPRQRCIAQVIDLTCIALLSTLSAWSLALITSFTFFRASRELKGRSKRGFTRFSLRVLAVLALLFAVLLSLDTFYSDDEQTMDFSNATLSVIEGSNELAWNECDNQDCRLDIAESIGTALAEQNIDVDEVTGYIDNFLAETELEQSQLDEVKSAYMKALESSGENSQDTTTQSEDEPDEEAKPVTVIDQLQAITADWGMSLGWAALYYSVFTAWFNGRTPGKKLMNIRVLKLDGKPLSLWDSFGRYGGYSAGLATGLSGFLQIYWDPNRQSIQDKISETVVIKASR